MKDYEVKRIDNDFSYLNGEMSEKLISLFNEYDFLDLCKAVYCFNSFLGNRAHLEANLLLNLSLTKCKKAGNKHINSFSDFESLVRNNFLNLNNKFADDPVATDNGEIKIYFNKKFYKVYLGNSYNFSFPLYQIMDSVARSCGIVGDLLKAFEYTDKQITLFSNNKLPDNYEYEKCYIPTKDYYEEVFSKYSPINDDTFLKAFSDCDNKDVSCVHFIIKNNKLFPLFNTSLVIDCYHYLTKDKIDDNVADIAFCNSLIYNYNLFFNSNSVLIGSAIVDDLGKHTIIGDFVFKAAIFNKETLILFSNIDDWNKTNRQEIIKQINAKKDSNNLYIAELSNDKTRVAKLSYIASIVFVDYIPELCILGGSIIPRDKKLFAYHILDLVHLFYQSENFDDIIEFIRLDYNDAFKAFQFLFSGNITKYNYWIANKKQISKGAIDFDLISTGVYDDELSLIDKYKEYDLWFPFDYPSELFRNPFFWKTHKEYIHFVEISDKSQDHSFGGQARKVIGHTLFLSQNLDLYKNKNQHLLVSLQNMQELNARYFFDLELALVNSGFYSEHNIKFLHLPLDYAREVDNTGFTRTSNKYVYSDAMLFGDTLQVRYAIDFDSLEKDLMNANDNSVELVYLFELLSCLKNINYINFDYIEKAIEKLKGKKKKVNLVAKEIKYYVSDKTHEFYSSDFASAKVEKEAAIICKEAGLEYGEYNKKDFCQRIRKLQDKLIPLFESKIACFDKYALHSKLLSVLSAFVLNKTINNDRKNLIDDSNLDFDAQQDCENNIIKANEKYTSSIRLIEYLIDTNLSIDHNGIQLPSNDDIDYLLAFSERMMLFQNGSDQAHYNLLPISLIVDNEYLINVQYSENAVNELNERNKRRLGIVSYLPSVNSGIGFLNEALESFYRDTNVHLNYVFDVCEYLKFEFTYTFKNEEQPNVFKIEYDELLSDLYSVFPQLNKDELKDAFDYLIIDETKIKQLGDSAEKFVPVWEREKRVHRIETKPIVKDVTNVIFSPITINSFSEAWKNGVFNFYPLYEYGLNNFMTCLEEWKHKCEKQMEDDMKNLFPNECGIKNIDLSKRDKGFNHPTNLGDYDVLGINKEKKIIYNLESKYLVLAGSIREYYNQQNGFFNCDRRDEKFQRRIDYLTANKERILKAIFKVDNGGDYIVKNYMVTNKLFYSDLKEIDFDIITFSELKTIIDTDFDEKLKSR